MTYVFEQIVFQIKENNKKMLKRAIQVLAGSPELRLMLYVGNVLEKRLDVNAILDSVVTSDLIRMCVFGSALYHCHNWRERFVPLYCMYLQLLTVLWRRT